MDKAVVVFLVAALIIGLAIFAFMALTRRRGVQLDQAKYQSDWLAIESSLSRDNPASIELAVLDADKLVDKALRQRGFRGDTMGARMKAAQSMWSNANHVWTAHKLRNRIAHEHGTQTDYDLARRALGAYKQALKDLGAI